MKTATLVLSVKEIKQLLKHAKAGSKASYGRVVGKHTTCITFELCDNDMIHTHRITGFNPFNPTLSA